MAAGKARRTPLELLVRDASGWSRRRVSCVGAARLSLIGTGMPGGILAPAGAVADDVLARIAAPSRLVILPGAEAILDDARSPRPRSVAARRRGTRTPGPRPQSTEPLILPDTPGEVLSIPLSDVRLTPRLARLLAGRATVADLAAMTVGDLCATEGVNAGTVAKLRLLVDEAGGRLRRDLGHAPRPRQGASLVELLDELGEELGEFDRQVMGLRLGRGDGVVSSARDIARRLGVSNALVYGSERRSLELVDRRTGILLHIAECLEGVPPDAEVEDLDALLSGDWARGIAPEAAFRVARVCLRIARRDAGRSTDA
jgi:hypothetical protein